MRPEYGRSQRVEHVMEETLAELMLRRIKDPRVHGVTVTDVAMTPDLRHATIYIAVSRRSKRGEQEALEGVRSALGFLRREIGRQLKLRYTPELEVELDTSLVEAQRIEKLIASAKKDMGARPPDDDDAAESD